MSQIHTANSTESATWKKLFLGFALFVVVIMPYLSKDYGMSGDEWLQIEYGYDVWDYFANGNQQAVDYTNKKLQYSGMHYYGGLFDYGTELLHRAFPSIPHLVLRHFFNALFGAVMMIFIGLITFRISKKWSVALLALLFIFFSPRLFGESMNNPKDIPFACGFAMSLYGIIAFLQDFPKRGWRNVVFMALGFAITFGLRPAGGLLMVCYGVMFAGFRFLTDKGFRTMLVEEKYKLLKRALLLVLVAVAGGYGIALMAWPRGLQDPLFAVFTSLKEMSNRDVQLRVLFEGVYRMNDAMPWYYEFKWFIISNPLIVLAGTALFIVFIRKAIQKYGSFSVFVIVFCAFFPVLYMIYKKSAVHDTWRHVMFVYTNWIVMSALAFDILGDIIKNEKLKFLPLAIAVLGLTPAIVWTVRSHPNQYVYFNELQGGPAGANGYYDLDYYQNSGKQCADWLKKNVKPIPGRKTIVLSNMSAIWKYFENDTAWIMADYGRYNELHKLDWDYYIAYPRYISPYLLQNDLWPPKNAIHTVSIDGAPLTAVLKRNCPDAFKLVQAKQYDSAARMYEDCIKAGKTDADVYFNYGLSIGSIGNLDGAVAAMEKAKELDPTNLEYMNTLAQVYDLKGDAANANRIKMEMQKAMMRDNEYEE